MEKHTKKGKEDKKNFSRILPNNQIITSCSLEIRVQEITMTEKLTIIGLTLEAANDFEPETNE